MSAWTKELDQTMDQVTDVVAARTQSAILEGIARGTAITFAQLSAAVAASAPTVYSEFLLIDATLASEPVPEPAPEPAPEPVPEPAPEPVPEPTKPKTRTRTRSRKRS